MEDRKEKKRYLLKCFFFVYAVLHFFSIFMSLLTKIIK